jgi:RimJ/RimL family protein N-acetyltransferase
MAATSDIIFTNNKYCFKIFNSEDFDNFCALNMNPIVSRYVNHNGGKPKTLEECQEKFEEINWSQENFGHSYWAVWNNITGEFMGQCGANKYKYRLDSNFCYAFWQRYWGQGIGYEICSLVLNYLLENFPNIELLTTSSLQENIASIKIIEKLGFECTELHLEYGKILESFVFKRFNYGQKNNSLSC